MAGFKSLWGDLGVSLRANFLNLCLTFHEATGSIFLISVAEKMLTKLKVFSMASSLEITLNFCSFMVGMT